MSGVNVTLDFLDAASPRLAVFVAGLRRKRGLHEAISKRALFTTREHLRHIAQTRHATAQRLGAPPTGHWAQATEKTRAKFDESAATITVTQPGITRAEHDITIVPGAGKKFLALPLRAEAYGRRAYRVQGLYVRGRALFKKGDERPWYALVRRVRQKQDRTLLPSDAELKQAALEGVNDYVNYLRAVRTEAARRGGSQA